MSLRRVDGRTTKRSGRAFKLAVALSLVGGLAVAASTSALAGTKSHARKAAASSQPRRGGNITFVSAGLQWSNLDPGTSPLIASAATVFDSLYDSVFNTDPKGDILPGLATGYSISKNRLAITITLRKGVEFSDGTPWNAQALVFNLTRDDAPTCQCYTGISAMTTAVAMGRYTVVVHLSQPSSVFIHALALGGGAAYQVSPTAFQKEGAANFQTAPVGAGPFVVSQNLVNSQLVLARNSKYWDKPQPYLNALTIISTGSDAASYASLQGNTAQIMQTGDYPTEQEGRANRSIQAHVLPPTTFNFINPQTQRPPFNNLIAREALFEAIDQKSIVQDLTLGYAKAGEGMIAPGELYYPGPKVKGFLSYNPTDAAAKVKQVGGISFTFFDCGTATPAVQQLTSALATMWEAVGMNVTIQNYSHVQAIGYLNSGNFQVDACGYGGAIDPALTTAAWISYPTAFNAGSYNDPAVDQLVQRAAQTFNGGQRASLYLQALVKVNQDAAYYPLYYTTTYDFGTKAIHGWGDLPFLQFGNIWLAK